MTQFVFDEESSSWLVGTILLGREPEAGGQHVRRSSFSRPSLRSGYAHAMTKVGCHKFLRAEL
jgi:hypothetical protein